MGAFAREAFWAMGVPEGSSNRKVNCAPPGVPSAQVSLVSEGPFTEKLNKSGFGVGGTVNPPPAPGCCHNMGGADVLPGARVGYAQPTNVVSSPTPIA